MTTPRFTICVPSYNGGEMLRQCVHSVLGQQHDSFELVVLEDGSTDGSLAWLQSLDDPRLKIHAAPRNLGIVANWGRITAIPKGEFMTIVGQDDLLDSDYLSVMDDLIGRHPDASLFHAQFRSIDKQGNVTRSGRGRA